jgi:hypothetical protein
MKHNFHQSLAQSHRASDSPVWENVYQQVFPGFLAMHDHRKDGVHQRHGIDRSVVLENGKTIWIDEKARERNKKTGLVYRDIALEFLSDAERETPGWVCKPLLCDYIAYAILPLGIAYVLPTLQLQQAWTRYSQYWFTRYPVIHAENGDDFHTWTTHSLCVPSENVMSALTRVMVARFPAIDELNESHDKPGSVLVR